MKKIIPLQYKKLLADIGKFAKSNNIKIWAIGGCVRDWYLRKQTKDIDLIVEKQTGKTADFISKKLHTKKEAFETFGTYRFKLKSGFNIDLAQTRREIYIKPAVLPKVCPSDIKKDILRRDFTINTVAISIIPTNFGQIYDPLNGLHDIKNGIIKVLHKKSFIDDPTRIFRAIRFAGRFGWKLDSETSLLAKKAVSKNIPALLSRFRIARELICILNEKNPEPVFKMLEKYKAVKFFHPHLKWNKKALILKDVNSRLGVLACSMGKNGLEFLKSLNLKRKIFLELKKAIELNIAKTAPSKPFTVLQKTILKTANDNLSDTALKPLVITGRDLQKLNIKPQSRYSIILNKIARLQWQGKIKTKKQALEFIKTAKNFTD